jgi:hypothetical protein
MQQHIDLSEWHRRVAVDFARAFPLEAANERPPTQAFLVQIKSGREVISEFGAMGTDALAVAAEYDLLKGPGQYIKVVPASRKEEPFPVLAARQELATAEVRQAIPEVELIAADLARNEKKGQQLAARNDAAALELQVQHLRCIGGL